MLEGYVDWLDDAGGVHGWVRDHASERPRCVALYSGDQLIARAVADEFRTDLFRDHVGHGHYGYSAQVSHGGPIRTAIKLIDTATLQVLNADDVKEHASTQRARRKYTTMEAAIKPGAEWEEGDLYEHVSIFRLEQQLDRMHPIRFLDCVWQFLLGRWSDEKDRAENLKPLRDGVLHPDELFRSVLTSEERRTNGLPLVGPFHHRFPFDLIGTFGSPAPPGGISP